MNFNHKSIILTGASAGIGEVLALELARRGARLTLAARRADALQRIAHQCVEAGGHALAGPTDVRNQESCCQLVERAAQQFGGVDVLINNAGISL